MPGSSVTVTGTLDPARGNQLHHIGMHIRPRCTVTAAAAAAAAADSLVFGGFAFLPFSLGLAGDCLGVTVRAWAFIPNQ